jgi:hypothetical protein
MTTDMQLAQTAAVSNVSNTSPMCAFSAFMVGSDGGGVPDGVCSL